MYAYEVGKCYHEAIRQEGTVFDIADDGAYLTVYFYEPSNEEVEQFNFNHPFEFRYVTLHDIVMCIFRIGNLNWMDAPYTPHLSKNLSKFALPADGEGLSLTLSLFDCSTGELKSLRYISLSTVFTRKLFGELMELKTKSFSQQKFAISLNSIYTKYSTKDLLKLSLPGFEIY